MLTESAHSTQPLDVEFHNPVTESGLRTQKLASRVSSHADFQFILATAAARFQLPIQSQQNNADTTTDNPAVISNDVINNAQQAQPLSTQDRHYQSSRLNSQYTASGTFESLRLHLLMHPEPLSLYNNPYQIDEDVLANGFFLEQQQENISQNSDPTRLHDIYIKP